MSQWLIILTRSQFFEIYFNVASKWCTKTLQNVVVTSRILNKFIFRALLDRDIVYLRSYLFILSSCAFILFGELVNISVQILISIF